MNDENEPDPRKDELKARFAKAYKKVADASRKAAPAYWDLGDKAIQLKKAVGTHGAWLPWLEEHDYVLRTTQKAMRIRRNFSTEKGGKAKLVELGLTVEEAEQYDREPKPRIKSPWSELLAEADEITPDTAELDVWGEFLNRFPDAKRAVTVALAMVRTYMKGETP